TGTNDRAWATPLDFDQLPADAAAIGDDLVRAVEREVVPADLAQVTYTSGSSAEPKGVVHTHGTVVRATSALAALQSGDGPPRFFCAFPFFWIGGTLVLGAALQSGATLLQSMRDHPSFLERDLPAIPGLTVGPADVALVESPVPGVPAHRGMSET